MIGPADRGREDFLNARHTCPYSELTRRDRWRRGWLDEYAIVLRETTRAKDRRAAQMLMNFRLRMLSTGVPW